MYTLHSDHKDMPADAVLAYDCPRCREHAQEPFKSLDDSHLLRLEDFVGYHVYHKPQTVNDSIAVSHIQEVFDRYNRIMRIR